MCSRLDWRTISTTLTTPSCLGSPPFPSNHACHVDFSPISSRATTDDPSTRVRRHACSSSALHRQLCAREPTFTISSLTCNRLHHLAFPSSSLIHCDASAPSAHYARVGGLAPADFSRLERTFLASIDLRASLHRESSNILHQLVAHSARFTSLGRRQSYYNDNITTR